MCLNFFSEATGLPLHLRPLIIRGDLQIFFFTVPDNVRIKQDAYSWKYTSLLNSEGVDFIQYLILNVEMIVEANKNTKEDNIEAVSFPLKVID